MEQQQTLETPKKSAEYTGRGFQDRVYEVAGTRIKISWKEFSPIPKEGKPLAEISRDEAVLVLPGWSAKAAAPHEELAQNFANYSERKALSITTKPEKVIPDSLYEEARAIRELIAEKGLKKITLVAHSQGGIKAVDLIDILQKENQDIKIQGLILLDPVGLYEQGKMELAGKFSLDTAVSTPITLTKNLLKDPSLWLKGLQATSDIIFNIAKEMVKAKGVGYPKKLWSQITEMARKNTHYQDVRCPVVLIQGEQDIASDHKRIIPTAEDPKLLRERRKILKETFFKQSPQVDMLVPKKLGHHGLPLFRAESVARASLGLLKRFWKKQESLAELAAQSPTAPTSQGETLYA